MSNKNPTYEDLLAENSALLEINAELGQDCVEFEEIEYQHRQEGKIMDGLRAVGVFSFVCVAFAYICSFAGVGANAVIGMGMVDYSGAIAIQLFFGIAVPLMYVYFFYNLGMRMIVIFSDEAEELSRRIKISNSASSNALREYDESKVYIYNGDMIDDGV